MIWSNLGFSHEPALWVAAINALVMLAVVIGIIPLDPGASAALSMAITAIGGLIVRQQVTPNARLDNQ